MRRREEPVSPSSGKGRERLRRLRKRLAHLEERDRGPYDRAEASSLRWAIRLLEELGAADQRALIDAHGDGDLAALLEGLR